MNGGVEYRAVAGAMIGGVIAGPPDAVVGGAVGAGAGAGAKTVERADGTTVSRTLESWR